MHCKRATVAHYALMLRKHIVPALGELLVAEVERKHIMAFQYGLRDMPTVANRGVDILVKMFGLADAWGWRPSGKNPRTFWKTGRCLTRLRGWAPKSPRGK